MNCVLISNVVDRHVSSSDRLGKRYRNTASVFSIADDDDGKLWFKVSHCLGHNFRYFMTYI